MSIFTPVKFRYDLWRAAVPTRRLYGVSYGEQLREAWELFQLNELEPYEYNDLHLSDPKLSFDEKQRFMSYNQTCIFHRELNPQVARGVLNKWVFWVYMNSYGITTPRVFGLFDPEFGYTPEREPLRSVEDFQRVINRNNLTEFVIKPASGAKGFDVTVIVERRGDTFIAGDGREYGFAGIREICLKAFRAGQPLEREGIVLQERVHQHDMLSRINPHCTNTMRVVTFVNNQGEVEILMTLMKFGRGRAMVDNVKQGAFLVDVAEYGTLGPGMIEHPGRIEWLEKHPDTGAQIVGEKLPFYHEAIALARAAQRRLPQLRSLGFDTAITNQGPTIIEGNAWWSAYPQLPMRRGLISEGMREVLNQIMPRNNRQR